MKKNSTISLTLSINEWPALLKQCNDFFEKCKVLLIKDSLLTEVDRQYTHALLNPDNLSLAFKELVQLATLVMEFARIFKEMYPEKVPEYAQKLSKEIVATKLECTFYEIILYKISSRNFLYYLSVPDNTKPLIDKSIQFPTKEEQYILIQYSSNMGWYNLQRHRSLYIDHYYHSKEKEGEALYALYSQQFENQQLDIFKHFKLHFPPTPALKKARLAGDFIKCDNEYKKAIKQQKNASISYDWQWEHTQNFFQRSFHLVNDGGTNSSKIKTLIATLKRTLSCCNTIASSFNARPSTQKDSHISSLSSLLNAVLYFLYTTYSDNVKKWSLVEREEWLDLLKQMVEINFSIAVEDYTFLQTAILNHKKLIDSELINLMNEKTQLQEKLEEQQLIEQVENQMKEDYQLKFSQLLAAFEEQPSARKKKASRKSQSAETEQDDDDNQSDDEETNVETIEDPAFLKVHKVIFLDQPDIRKKQCYLNGQTLTNALMKARREKDDLAIMQNTFALGDFHRLKALEEMKNNLSEAVNHLLDSIKFMYKAVQTSNSLNNNDTEISTTRDWATLVLKETETLLQRCSNKIDKNLETLALSRNAAKEHILKKYGKHGWFKQEKIDWDDLSPKSQQHIILTHDQKRIREIQKNFLYIKDQFTAPQNPIAKERANSALADNQSSHSVSFFKKDKGKKRTHAPASCESSTMQL